MDEPDYVARHADPFQNTPSGPLAAEPAVFAGLAQLLAAVAVIFGFEISDEAAAAVIGLLGLGLSLLVRAKVTPVAKLGRPRLRDVSE